MTRPGQPRPAVGNMRLMCPSASQQIQDHQSRRALLPLKLETPVLCMLGSPAQQQICRRIYTPQLVLAAECN